MQGKALVTGAAGFIGSHLVNLLARDGWEVVAFDNFSSSWRSKVLSEGVAWIEGDVAEPGAVRDAAQGCSVIFHLAALGSVSRSVRDPLLTHRSNATGTLQVFEAARVTGVRRIVWASSSSVYGDTPVLPKVETMVPRPRSPYAVSKLTGEYYAGVYAALHGLEIVGLRYFNVFGPRQNPESEYAAVIPRFVKAALGGEKLKIHGDGEQTRDFTYVDNVVEANLLASRAPLGEASGQAFNIGCGGRHSLNALVAAMGRELGRSLQVEYGPARPGDVRDSMADVALAERILGYHPVISFEEGLRRTVAWYAAEEKEAGSHV